MSYQALYRVWRPQALRDFAGQEHITKTLQNALVQNKFSHAYLFTGPRGTGKTSAAKIIAKAVNCQEAPVAEPCNECTYCKGITEGQIVDVIEIDAASNNGVDEIRDIRDKVKFAPSVVRYKVYIIDEVHMLSTGAFNALLKTLEEPPSHVIFILATTEPHKIPLTIISRCQRFDFKQISSQDMIQRMRYILSHYDVEVTDEALEAIARAADGGMRDALSLLDQALSYATDKVTIDDVLLITGAVSQQLLTEIVQNVQKQDAASALKLVDILIKEGKDPNRFIEDLIFYFRDLLLYKTSPNLTDLLERAKLDDAFIELAHQFANETIYEMIEKLSESQQQMKWASSGKIFLELAIVKLCQQEKQVAPANLKEIEQLKEKMNQLEQALKSNRVEQAPTEKRQPTRKVEPKLQTNVAYSSREVKEMLQTATKKELQTIVSKWAYLMDLVRNRNIRMHAWLVDCKPVAANQETIVLAFQNEMHRDMIDTKFKSEVVDVLLEVYNRSLQILPILSAQWEKVKEEYVKAQRANDTNERENDPLVEEGIKLVGEDLVEIIENH